MIQLRSDLEQMRGCEKEPDSGFTLKVELRIDVDRFGVGYEREREARMIPRLLASAAGRMELPFAEMFCRL